MAICRGHVTEAYYHQIVDLVGWAESETARGVTTIPPWATIVPSERVCAEVNAREYGSRVPIVDASRINADDQGRPL